MNILIFGGDLRQIAAAKYFRDAGHDVKIFAVERSTLEKYGAGDMFSDIAVPADITVFPLPTSSDGETINCPLSNETFDFYETFRSLKAGSRVFVGMSNSFEKNFFSELKLNVTDYFESDEIQIENAVPTAEGAIELFLRNEPITLMDSRVVVIGYGRIGAALSKRLRLLGADVTVSARSEKDLALAHTDGVRGIHLQKFLKEPGRPDCIFNTVPARIFDRSFAEKICDALFIDLASKPFGVTEDAVAAMGEKYIRGSSLPGKTAPVTAGRIIARSILKHLESEDKT